MEHVSTALDLPAPEMKMRMVGQVPSNDLSHHFTLPNEQMGVAEPMPSNLGFQNMYMPNNRENELEAGMTGSNAFWMANQQGHVGVFMPNNQIGEKSLLSSKRKAEVEPMLNKFVSLQSLIPNKRAEHMGANFNSPGLLQQSAPQKKTGLMQSKMTSPGLQTQPVPNKKMMKSESMSSKSGVLRGQNSKRQTAQIESAPKVQRESSEAVRSKMRESLAAALSLAFENQDKVTNTDKEQTNAAITNQIPVGCQPSESNLTTGTPVPGSGDMFPSKELASAGKTGDSQVLSSEPSINDNIENGGQAFREFHFGNILPDESVSFGDNFFVKDDLLQGNGLSWALDFDSEIRDGKEAQNSDKLKSLLEEAKGAEDRGDLVSTTPISLAFKVEAELFKLFGGINKKYKEKGRSLLFNLKDRSNPELRERVVSGEISPERLCSMSAEELASKELSEWRMAKAEELAQMVVLPDTDVDIRRLVKKTHKGEYQVEIEHDYGIAAEVSGGATMLTQLRPKKKIETHSLPEDIEGRENSVGQEKKLENLDFSGSLIIPTDGADLMQGMIVDELKDAEFLPPIVSLDEFMESLNSEPPFDNLPEHASKTTPVSHKESPEKAKNSLASDPATENSAHILSNKADEVVKEGKVDLAMQSTSSRAVQKVFPANDTSKVEYIWEGTIQLNISSSVTVGGGFQSGEKTSTKEWPSSLEIKGRVRVEAFGKFYQELPMSRTRAVMILNFVLKDKSSEHERALISEAVASYAAEDRLGFAEPAPGVELYLCPRTSRMFDLLSKHVSEERNEMLNSSDNGLIGVVVWRRSHISNAISPNSSSHHKHIMKKQSFASPRGGQNSNNNKNTLAMAPPVPYNTPRSIPEPQPEEDDDIPPGFGPVAAKDDDDLPEFNFTGELKPSAPRFPAQNLHPGAKVTPFNQTPKRSVDQVRELIQKYGQTDTSANNRTLVDNRNLGIEPWNDNDDDDIPEWRPQALNQLNHSQPPSHGFHVPMHHPLVNQRVIPSVSLQSPRGPASPSGLASWPPGTRWVQPPASNQQPRWRH